MAACGLFRPINLARGAVKMVTKTDLKTPAAIEIAITDESAPIAAPVTGPTIKVHAPAPMVVKLTASR